MSCGRSVRGSPIHATGRCSLCGPAASQRRLIESGALNCATLFHTDDCRRLEKVSGLILATSRTPPAGAEALFHLHLISFGFSAVINGRRTSVSAERSLHADCVPLWHCDECSPPASSTNAYLYSNKEARRLTDFDQRNIRFAVYFFLFSRFANDHQNACLEFTQTTAYVGCVLMYCQFPPMFNSRDYQS